MTGWYTLLEVTLYRVSLTSEEGLRDSRVACGRVRLYLMICCVDRNHSLKWDLCSPKTEMLQTDQVVESSFLLALMFMVVHVMLCVLQHYTLTSQDFKKTFQFKVGIRDIKQLVWISESKLVLWYCGAKNGMLFILCIIIIIIIGNIICTY